jgi:hypothetical protein
MTGPLSPLTGRPGTTGSTNATLAPNSTTNNPNRQYMLVYYDGTQWRTSQVSQRTSDTAFDGPGGSSGQFVRDLGRPIVLVDQQNRVLVVIRSEDTSMGSYSNANLGLNKNNIVVYYNEDLMSGNTINSANWKTIALDSAQMGSYEPTYDSALWKKTGVLDLFCQPMGLGQSSAAVKVLEWDEQQYFAALEPHLGDLNLDGAVNNFDIQAMLNAQTNLAGYKTNHGLTGTDLKALADINGDNTVDLSDVPALLSMLAGNAAGAGAVGAVPEVDSATLLSIALFCLAISRVVQL